MLVLSRQLSERILIHLPTGETITVTVVRIAGDKVRLGFDAPPEFKIVRDELEAA